MYLFVHYICFYSNIFGFETKVRWRTCFEVKYLFTLKNWLLLPCNFLFFEPVKLKILFLLCFLLLFGVRNRGSIWVDVKINKSKYLCWLIQDLSKFFIWTLVVPYNFRAFDSCMVNLCTHAIKKKWHLILILGIFWAHVSENDPIPWSHKCT